MVRIIHVAAALAAACCLATGPRSPRVDAFSAPRTAHLTSPPTTAALSRLAAPPITTNAAFLTAPCRSSTLFSSSSSGNGLNDGGGGGGTNDALLIKTSNALRRSSWISWWAQVILSTVSSVILLFARNIGRQAGAPTRGPSGGFLFAGSGIALSVMSVLWTWGGARLSRRLLRGNTSRISAANLTRRAIKVGASLNLTGMLVTLVGAFVVIGELATKVLTTQGFSPFGAAAGGMGAVAAQTIQPLDILIVQGNFNTLLSHFVSLFFALSLTRFVDRLDPPSTDDDPRD